jgi:hypothetical protein
MPARTKTKAMAQSPLVGLFFHSLKDDGKTIELQGHVKGHVGGPKDLYLLQLFEWITGGETHQELVPSEKMAGWRFYDSNEEMDNNYKEYDLKRQREQKKS